jgi:pyrimidine-nucleoside phosphorylase
MIPSELLRKKRDGLQLTHYEISTFINGVTNGTISQAQIGAFLMACCTKGLTPSEIGSLTTSMADSGIRYTFRDIHRPKIDKHSTGGVGDKISLLLAPLVAGCGLAVPMMSGRGLGHTGGTVDKLESIKGFRMDYNQEELQRLLSVNNMFMIKQTKEVAPADGILYSIRDVTGTVESVGLITASILSKKMTEDLDGLVMDMKVGTGAFMQTMDLAKELAEQMMAVAKEVGLNMTVVFTSMNTPLGTEVGNFTEMMEAHNALKAYDTTSEDVKVITTTLAVEMLKLGMKTHSNEGLPDSLSDSALRMIVERTWKSGVAHNNFMKMISAQEGNWLATLEEYKTTELYEAVLKAESSNYLSAMNTRMIGVAGIELGIGRKLQSDSISPYSGISFIKKTGDFVNKNEPICVVRGESINNVNSCMSLLKESISYSDSSPNQPPLILDIWSS